MGIWGKSGWWQPYLRSAEQLPSSLGSTYEQGAVRALPWQGQEGGVSVCWPSARGLFELLFRSQALPQLSAFIPQSKQPCIQNSLLCKNEILVLSFGWISSVAPFFFFNSDDFEKSVLKYTHIAAGLQMVVVIFISFSHGCWAWLQRQIWQVRFWPFYVLFSAQVAQDFFCLTVGFVYIMALERDRWESAKGVKWIYFQWMP